MRSGVLAGTTLLGAAGLIHLRNRRRDRDAVGALEGQVAAVTGGSRGLGFLLARELATHGCKLAICARDQRELERARDELIRGHGVEVLAVAGDISDRGDAERFIAAATEHFGRVDLLVNNAGIIQVGPVHTLGPDDFEQAVGVMFFGVVYPTLAVLPQMRARGHGRIVNITSIGGKVSVPHLLPYNAAKFAAVGFSEGLHAELARDGISVTTVVPGLMRTGSHLNALFTGDHKAEFTWFSLGASLPLISMDAERAVRRIVHAAARGQAELILTPQAHLIARAQGLFPGTGARVLSVVDRFLPSHDDADQPAGTALRPGRQVLDGQPAPLLERLTALGTRAAQRFNQLPESSGPNTA